MSYSDVFGPKNDTIWFDVLLVTFLKMTKSVETRNGVVPFLQFTHH